VEEHPAIRSLSAASSEFPSLPAVPTAIFPCARDNNAYMIAYIPESMGRFNACSTAFDEFNLFDEVHEPTRMLRKGKYELPLTRYWKTLLSINRFERGFLMKKLFEIFLMVLVTMWLTLAFAAPPQKTSKASPAKQAGEPKEPMYQFLNPRGDPGPIKVQGLAKRLDTIKGKTIYVVVCEAGPQTGPFLYQYLKDHYPDTNWVRIQHNGFGPTDPSTEGEMLKKADAVIGGQSW
jgi:hypothetical protein